MKKKIIPVVAVVVLLVLVIGIWALSSLIKKYTPSKEVLDLKEYYSITADDQLAIILNQQVVEDKAKLIDGKVYLDYSFIHDNINDRYYWDANENILLYATDKELISAQADSSTYYVAKDSKDFGSTIVTATADSAYIAIDFLKLNSNFTYTQEEEPNRLVITSEFGEYNIASIKKKTQVRQKGGIKSPILTETAKNDKVYVLEEDETWTKVMTESGIIGYVKSKLLVDKTTENIASDFNEETYSHIVKDYQISLGWHQVAARSANNDIANVLSATKGINVISPTWFYLNDNKGGIVDLASQNYVTYCHQHGVEVWALISNLENSEVDTAKVLSHTSTRQALVNQIVAAAIKYELDGINLDFEALNSEAVGESFIQFVRELSIKLGNNGVVLSIDNYVPSNYTAFYDREEQANFADYIIIMGYDQHYSGSASGSVASLDWVKQSVEDTLKEVPASQTILGMPFYTRVWELKPKSEDVDDSIDILDEETELSLYDVSSSTYTMSNAANLIASYQAETSWDETAGQDYATWTNNGSIFKVWLENSNSFEARMPLIEQYKLAGAAYWKLGLESKSIWDTIIKYNK